MKEQEEPSVLSSTSGTKSAEHDEKLTDVMGEKSSEKSDTVTTICTNNDYGDEKDCGYVLRALEKDAFSAIVSAFRAQGMLNEYKKVLLEHLKAALFIPDETYHAEIRQAANDELLSKVAQTLNPSYDNYAEWGIEGEDPSLHYGDIPIRDDIDESSTEINLANELLQLANRHNARLRDENAALQEMIALPKAPYVPERLRLLLRQTESDYEGRIDTLPPDARESRARNSRAVSNSIKTETVLIGGADRSSKKVESIKGSCAAGSNQRTAFYYDIAPSTSTAHSNSLELVTSCPSSSSSSTPAITSLDQTAFVSQTSVQVEGDDDFGLQGNAEISRPRKRRLRQRDLSTTCARVLPFRFQSPAPGQKSKPIRGNPDRRPPRQVSPPGISNFTSASLLPNTSSTSSPHSTHVMALPAFRTIPATSTTVMNSGRLHQVPHLATSGVVIKRARTLSSGGSEPNLEENSTFARHLPNAQNVFRIQQPVQRAYIRSSSGQRFYASPIISAYSNPARPYYGNPNAVVGFMRSLSATGAPGSYTISSSSSTPSVSRSQPQTITSTEIQRLVAQAAATGQPQQYRPIRRPPITATRPVALGISQRLSVSSQRRGPSPTAPSFINSAEQGILNSSLLQQQQQQQQTTSRVPHRSISSSSVVASAQRARTVLTTPLDDNTSLARDIQLQNLSHSDPDTTAAVNSITQAVTDDDDRVEQERTADTDGSVIAVNCDARRSDGVRLECDEILLPESRCVLPSYGNNLANVQVAQLQQRTGGEEMIVGYRGGNHASHRVPEQYPNGLIHQEGQNVIGYISAPQCIQ